MNRVLAVLLSGFLFASVGCAGPRTFVDRRDPRDLRIVSYNILWDSIFPDADPKNHPWRKVDARPQFTRLMRALNPDIICLQEINPDRDPADVAAVINAALPDDALPPWQAAIGGDCVIVTRWPINYVASNTIPPADKPMCAALVDLPDDRFPRDIYLMNQHFKCCGGDDNEARRRQHADALINWIRDARSEGGEIDLPDNTPLMVLGDLNIVAGPEAVNTLCTGDIQDEANYGVDFPPDWDGTAMNDLHPLHNVVGADDYTWRDDASRYKPARLDYMIYTDSVLRPRHCYVLNTLIMTDEELEHTGLKKDDVVMEPPMGVDHYPLVVDLVVRGG